MNQPRTPAIVEWTRNKVNRLAQGYIQHDPTATAAIAQLRKCADGKPHSDPDILQWTLEGLPMGAEREWAASLTLGLFAITQRANHTTSCQNDERPFMRALADMVEAKPEWANGITRQRKFVDSTDTPESLARRLAALARQMNNAGMTCDWGWMAYRLQQWANPDTRNAARLQWGRDYHRTIKNTKTDNKENTK